MSRPHFAFDRLAMLGALKERMTDGEVDHCLRVERLARELAAAHGLDSDKAAAAGLLHDYCRGLSRDELLARGRQCGLRITKFEEDDPYLLHAPLAAVLLHEEQGVTDEELLSAVARHTLGHTEMSSFDAVVYLADHLEPGRRLPWANGVRERAFTDLWGALRDCMCRQLCAVIEKGRAVHPQGIEAWNSLVARGWK